MESDGVIGYFGLLGFRFDRNARRHSRRIARSTLAALAKLAPADRQARIVEGAKKESGLVWYSSTTAEDALALTKKFHEQHPSIQIKHFRSSSEKLLERILAESRANAFNADLVSLPELELSVMIKRKLLARYEATENNLYPAESQRSARLLDRAVHVGLGAGVQHQVGGQRRGAEVL